MPDRSDFTVFSTEFLRLTARREPVPLSTYEAHLAGPWKVESWGQEYAVVREAGAEPEAIVGFRDIALLLAAALPATARGLRYWIAMEPTGDREVAFTLKTTLGEHGPTTVGRVRSRHEELLLSLSTLDHVLRSPSALAFLLEAASLEVLSQAGAILAERC